MELIQLGREKIGAAALALAGLLPGADLGIDDHLIGRGRIVAKGKDLAGAWLLEHEKKLGVELMTMGQKLTGVGFGRAQVVVQHHRRYHYSYELKTWLEGADPVTGKYEMREVGEPDGSFNLITNAGRIFLHKQGYDTTGLGANGLNYIAVSNDTVGETASSTTLSTEIAANGLTRAQGTVTLPTGSGNVTTVVKVFTATGTQSAQKAALFTASSSGTMNHVLSFTQRNLINTDTLTVTFSITLG